MLSALPMSHNKTMWVWSHLWQVTLSEGNHNRHLCRPCMGQSLPRLRHDTIICRHCQHHDVCGGCSARTHGTKGSMSGCVQKGEHVAAARHLDFKRPDVLRDSASLCVVVVVTHMIDNDNNKQQTRSRMSECSVVPKGSINQQCMMQKHKGCVTAGPYKAEVGWLGQYMLSYMAQSQHAAL